MTQEKNQKRTTNPKRTPNDEIRTTKSEDQEVIKIPTGIPGFDHISMGGLPQGRASLLSGTSGSGKTLFALQFLHSGIQDYQEGGVFVTFEERPQHIKGNMKSFGWNLKELEEKQKLAFVDVSPSVEKQAESDHQYDFSPLLARMEHAVNKVNATRIALDSIGTLFSQFTDSAMVRGELFRIIDHLRNMGVTALITAEREEDYGRIARFGVEEFVADNVLLLRNIMEGEKRRRTIEVLKFRGTFHQNGEYPFTIARQGIEVLPLSAMKLEMESAQARISSGNPELDKMCGEGFYRDSIILVSGPTGTGKTLLVTTFLGEGCRNEEKTLVFAFEESRSQLLRNAISWNKDFRQWEEKGLLKIICVYPETASLTDHLLNMKNEITDFAPQRIAIDSLSALERVSGGKAFREFTIGLTSYIKEFQIAGLFTSTTPSLMGGGSVTEEHISTITDSIILLRYVEVLGAMHRGIAVLKMRGSWHDKDIREYKIDETGMHIGTVFRNVTGIISGAPQQALSDEHQQVGGMFE